jgi:glycosyltransferase involved in cell wall biosynthesis
VTTTDEWVATLRRLINDATLRDRLGAAGRARVVERYSIDVIAPRFAGAIREATSLK